MTLFRADKTDALLLLVIALLPILVALPLLSGWLHADPALLLGAMSQHMVPGPVGGSPYIDPNDAYTTQALGVRAALDWLHGTVPWWNAYSGVGLPLAGEYQPAAFFPLTLLLALPNGMLLEHILLQILAGWGAYVLLRQLGLIRLAALTGGLLFAFNGTLAWFDHAPMLPVPLLPWMLWGIERAFIKASTGERGGWRVFAVALGLNVLAGFPETAYLQGLMVLAWAVLRLFQSRNTNRWPFSLRVALGGLVGLALAAPQVLAFFDFLPLSWLGGHDGQFAHAALATPALVPSLFAPYIYGTIFSHLNALPELVYIWGNIGGYVTTLMLGLAVYGFLVRRDALAWLLLGCILIALAKTFGIEPVVSLLNLIPGIPAAAFYRYATPVWELSVIVLAMFGLHALASGEIARAPRLIAIAFVLATIAGVGLYAHSLARFFHISRGMHDAVIASMAWMILTSTMFCALLFTKRLKRRAAWLSVALVVEGVLMYAVPTLSNPRQGELDMAAISFLQHNLGLQRFYSLGPIQANYGAQFGIASINHAYLPIERHWVEWVRDNLDRGADPIGFAAVNPREPGMPSAVESLRANLSNYEWIGVKYVVTTHGDNPFIERIVSQVGTTDNRPLVLMPGDAAYGTLPAGAGAKDTKIDAFGVMQGNFGHTATGALRVTVCSRDGCASGSADLATSADNTSFQIPLEHTLALHGGQPVKYRIEHVGGNTPLALWAYPTHGDLAAQHLTAPGGAEQPGMGLSIDLRVAADTPPPVRVYSDEVMDIYALHHAKPYFETVSGQCTVHPVSRTAVAADCSGPATLLRRERFFPGWSASVNGRTTEPSLYQDLFQSVPLAGGRSTVEFSFSPPHMRWAWITMWLALLGLAFPPLRRRLMPSH